MLRVLTRDDDDGLHPTLAGLLALGTYPQQFFPRLTVTFTALPTRDEKTGLTTYADARTMAGPIPAVLADTLQAVQENIREGEATALPLAAIREAGANALVHRDYSPLARGTAVQVSLLSDRLVITSPGGLYGTVTSESLGTPGYSSARNQFLLSLLENVPFSDGYLVENRKAGYRLICDELQHAGMPAPKADDHISSFEITLFRSGALPQAEELNDEVLKYLATVSDASATEIADATGLSRRTVTYRLSNYVESGTVERVGKPRSPKQRYRLR